MWGRLEWHYWIEDNYGDCQGIVEFLGDYVRAHSTPEDIKKVGYVAVVVIVMLVAWKAGEFLKNPNNKP